jgi:MoxR-like ATPase
MQEVAQFGEDIAAAWGRAVVGQEAVLQGLLVTLLIGGNALLQGPPGTAKTLSVKALARCLELPFGRIQFTPDLLPADLIGSPVLDPGSGSFRVRKGPVFTTFLLADEINRAPAKTQAALLEAMEERQVTIEGDTHLLPATFTVFATQNPLEYEGTDPRPEAQLDRFSLQIQVGYPGESDERGWLRRVDEGFDAQDLEAMGLAPVADSKRLLALRRRVRAEVSVSDAVLDYLLTLVRRTREDPRLLLGASPRAAATLLSGSKALAALRGRGFVTPDDVVDLAPAALRHRLALHGEVELEGLSADDVIARLIAEIPVPR